ncbi:MAG: hypothetical protein ACKO0M_03105 [Cyanobium sp.]
MDGASDPLSDAFAVMGGVAIALIAVLVPMVSVLSDSRTHPPTHAMRVGR